MNEDVQFRDWDSLLKHFGSIESLNVACQRDGTTLLPRVWDHLEVSVSIAGLAFGVKAGALVEAVSLPVGGSFDDQGVCS